MTKYSYTNKSLEPQKWANTAHFDGDMTAIKRQDSKQLNCGQNEGKNTVRFYPLVLFISALVSCLPAHAVSRSTFQTLLTASPLLSEFRISNAEFNRLYDKGNWKLLASPYRGTFSVPQNVNMEFLDTLGATTNATALQGKVIITAPLNTTKQVKQQAKDKTSNIKVLQKVEQQLERFIPFQNNFTKLNIETPSNNRQLKNPLTDVKSWRYDGDLLKTHVSGQTKPSFFGFFVPKICLDSQSSRPQHKHFTQSQQGKTVISMVSDLPTSYDGMTLQNTKAFGRICRAVADVTESESHHLMNIHNVLSTQKHTSGGYHA